MRKEYFCGWYFKCESDGRTFAVIPAIHLTKAGNYCSVQLITEEGAHYLSFPEEAFTIEKRGQQVRIGDNVFSSRGIRLKLHGEGLEAEGTLRFGRLWRLRYDIMGPFSIIPGMECRHSVFSMRHPVNGKIVINGTEYLFRDGVGYIEGDRGHSFPRKYIWTQCSFPQGSLMLSVADIPIGAFHFTGIICVVLCRGREYRLATYLGARATAIGNNRVQVRQRGLELTARLISKKDQPLKAPSGGDMTRIIRESAACTASYRFTRNGNTVFSFTTDRAAFEYEYPT